MQRLPEHHPEVQDIIRQMYGQRGQVGRISSVVGFLNMHHLQTELYNRGWVARLKDDQKTIYLEPASEESVK